MASFRGRGGRTRRCSLSGLTIEKTLLMVFLSLTLLVYFVEHNYLLVHSNRSKDFGGSWGFALGSRFAQNIGYSNVHKSYRIDAYDRELVIGSPQYAEELSNKKRSRTSQQAYGNHGLRVRKQGVVSKRDPPTEEEPEIENVQTYMKESAGREAPGGGQESSKKRPGTQLPGPASRNEEAPHRQLPHENSTRSVKIIELHTPLYNDLSWRKHLKGAFDLRQCPETRCKFVFYPDQHPAPDALVFHAPHIRKEAFSATRKPNQTYIMLSLEATGLHPQNGDMARLLKEGEGDSLFFDWTMTFHRHSDVQLTYGHFRSLRGESMGFLPGLIDPSSSTFRGYIEALKDNDLREEAKPDAKIEVLWWRPKMVVWLVSHCNTESGREFYVKELKRHLPVDTFGACGHLSCGSNKGGTCYKNVLSPKYKFYLAFENNMCEDYISEKPFRALLHGMVPVVFGGANYSQYLPPGSYIDATPLEPQALAQVILVAASTREHYGRFHLWRRFWKVGLFPPLCQLCAKLHNPNLHSSSSQVHPSRHLNMPHRFRLPSLSSATIDPSSRFSSFKNAGDNSTRRQASIANASSVLVPPLRSSNPPPVHPSPLSSSSPSEVPPPRRTLTKVWMWWIRANQCFTLYPEEKYLRTAQASSVVLQRLAPAGGLLGPLSKWVGALLGDSQGRGQVKVKEKGNG